ncbi:MAG: hypothetical protein AAGH70_02275 [Pseudomonadota bacterium]
MIVLLLGSGPTATRARDWPRAPWDRVVTINNAWRLRSDWDDLVFPHDFPRERMPKRPTGRLVNEADFVPAQNAFGGFLYAGATMAFTAAYWALHALEPRVIAFLGCDMVYPQSGATHFYGKGTADPLRNDVSLRNLEAKSARAQCHAAAQGCTFLNLSTEESRLTFPRATPANLTGRPRIDPAAAAEAKAMEDALDYRTPAGFHDHLSPDIAALDAIDALWTRAGGCDPALAGSVRTGRSKAQ